MVAATSKTVFTGDISPEAQEFLRTCRDVIIPDGSFAYSAGGRFVLSDVELFEQGKDGKLQLRVVYERLVTPGGSPGIKYPDIRSSIVLMLCVVSRSLRATDMLSHTKTLHGGCLSHRCMRTSRLMSSPMINFVTRVRHRLIRCNACFYLDVFRSHKSQVSDRKQSRKLSLPLACPRNSEMVAFAYAYDSHVSSSFVRSA